MHFWIDKRSQACGFNGRHGVPASLASGRRRNKAMVTPVHRFQSTESATVAQQLRRPYQQPQMTQTNRLESNQSNQCQSPVLSSEAVNGPIISRPTPPPELEAPVYLDAPLESTLETVPSAQLMRLGGLTKYGMWASFGLTTVSVAATKFYVDYQGTLEILLLCTLGVLSAGLLVSCVLTVCRRSTPPQFINVPAAQVQPTAVEMEIPEVMPQREMIITPVSSTVSQTVTVEARPTTQDFEQPPPPYHIAILLPLKENVCADLPPPTYENAVRTSALLSQRRQLKLTSWKG